MELRGDRVLLQPLEHVLEQARGEDDGVVVFAIVVEGEVAGMIQHDEETDEGLWQDGVLLDLLAGELT